MYQLIDVTAAVSYTHLDVYKRQLCKQRGHDGKKAERLQIGAGPMIKNRLRKVLMILFAAIFIFCIVRLVMIRVQYEQGNEIYSSAVDHYVSSLSLIHI